MKLSLGFSPCPNDTFIFDALVNGKIDTEGLAFDVHLEDVQTLNEWAVRGDLDVSKISYGVLPLVMNGYVVLNSGGALGQGVGPLLIATRDGYEKIQRNDPELQHASVAVPGLNTTANLLFSMAYPQAKHKKFMVFHQVEDAVLSGEVDAGVIIHENRFTYQDKGLVKIVDLGQFWEEQLNVPIPLGGIVMKRSFDIALQRQLDRLIRASIEYAFHNYPELAPYVRLHSQEMSEQVMRQHIDLYVNNYSLDLGDAGHAAVQQLLSVNGAAGTDLPIFID